MNALLAVFPILGSGYDLDPPASPKATARALVMLVAGNDARDIWFAPSANIARNGVSIMMKPWQATLVQQEAEKYFGHVSDFVEGAIDAFNCYGMEDNTYSYTLSAIAYTAGYQFGVELAEQAIA